MRHLRAPGLAAFAAAALTVFLYGSASATVLCREPGHRATCRGVGQDMAAGTGFVAGLKAGTNAVLEGFKGEFIYTKCTVSIVQTSLINTGNPEGAVRLANENWTWEVPPENRCTRPTETRNLGELEVDLIANTENGTVTANNFEVIFDEYFGNSCSYESAGADIGTLIGGNPATIKVNAELLRVLGPFICPTTVEWTAEYTIKSLSGYKTVGLWVAE